MRLILSFLILLPMSSWAGPSFMDVCKFIIANHDLPQDDFYKMQFSWLQTKFQTTNCLQIKKEIQKLESFNQLIPYFEYSWEDREDYIPFKPIQYTRAKFQNLTTKDKWDFYRQIFKSLELFSEFTNIAHLSYDPMTIIDQKNVCDIIRDIPSIKSVTIRYTNPQAEVLNLREDEIKCLQKNEIKIFIMGDFIPNKESEAFKDNIYGIENFLGDIKTLYQYRNLSYLGILNYAGPSSLKELIRIKNLSYLSVNINSISNPEDIGYLRHLSYLSLNCFEGSSSYQNKKCLKGGLKNIDFIRMLNSLKGLDLSWNDIKDLAPLSELKRLKHLNLRMNSIDLIGYLKNLKQLEYLDVSGNNISDISSLESLKSLKLVNISDNNVNNLEPLSYLPRLKYLSAGRNPYSLTGFEPSKSLKVLNLSGNISYNLSAFSHAAFQVSYTHESKDEQNWTNLMLFGQNRYSEKENTSIESSNNSIATYDMNLIKNVSILSLDNNDLKEIPTLFPLKELKFLSLSRNKIKDLAQLKFLANRIEYLALDNNKFNFFSLNNFLNLKFLDISGNDLGNSRINIHISNLKYLNLSNCNLYETPDLSKTTNLENLLLHHNSLKEFSAPTLYRLNQLTLWNNQLIEIPDLSRNISLKYVALNSNHIESFKNLDKMPREYDPLMQPMAIILDLSDNKIGDLSIFRNSEYFKNIHLILGFNPVNKSSDIYCPKTTPNESVNLFCNSP